MEMQSNALAKNESVNDLMSGLVLAMYEAYGGVVWLTYFFAELRTARVVNEGTLGGCDYADARDNLYRICSKAAKKIWCMYLRSN